MAFFAVCPYHPSRLFASFPENRIAWSCMVDSAAEIAGQCLVLVAVGGLVVAERQNCLTNEHTAQPSMFPVEKLPGACWMHRAGLSVSDPRFHATHCCQMSIGYPRGASEMAIGRHQCSDSSISFDTSQNLEKGVFHVSQWLLWIFILLTVAMVALAIPQCHG